MASPLGKLFGRSPIAPIQQHMQLAQETVQLLCEVLAACADGNFDRARELQVVIGTTLGDARALRRDIRRHLPGGLLLAMPRPDLLELLDLQAQLADRAGAVCQPLVLRQMHFEPSLQKVLEQYCSLLAAASGQALSAIRDLDEMITQGFGNHERKTMEKMLGTLDKQVGRCHTQRERLLSRLLQLEATLSPLDALFQYQLASELEQLVHLCSAIGEQIDLLIAR